MLAILFAFLASLGFASSSIFARVGLQQTKASAGTVLSLVVSFIMTTALALIFDFSAFLAIPVIAFLWFLLLGLLNFPLGRYLNFAAVDMVGASRATALVASSPLFAAILAIIFVGERPGWVVILGTVAIIAGLALVVSDTHGNTTKDKSSR